MKKKILVSMDPGATVSVIDSSCAAAVKNAAYAVCVPQWFVSYACGAVKGGTKVATLISLPNGTTSTFAKYAETKQAADNGADIVIIPMNMEMVKRGDITSAKGDLNSALGAVKGKKIEAFAIIDGSTEDGMVEAASAAADATKTPVLVMNPSEEALKAISKAGVKFGIYARKDEMGSEIFASSAV